MKSNESTLEPKRKAFETKLDINAQSYHEIGATQYEMKDYQSALVSQQHALEIRLKLLGEDHPDTPESYCNIGVIQYYMKDYRGVGRIKRLGGHQLPGALLDIEKGT
jgi:tetratricopeptide (TPR) repeat protein